MGKADNLKRAKKLKEAKRKRENDALLAAGYSPSAIAVKRRSTLNGDETIINQGQIKYSKLLESFVEPIMSNDDDIATVKAKYTFGALVWNAATMRELSEEAFQVAKVEHANIVQNNPGLAKLFDEMTKRKQEEFSEYKSIIAEFDIRKIRGVDYDLTVATIPLQDISK